MENCKMRKKNYRFLINKVWKHSQTEKITRKRIQQGLRFLQLWGSDIWTFVQKAPIKVCKKRNSKLMFNTKKLITKQLLIIVNWY